MAKKSGIRTPMQGTVVGRGKVPQVAANTTMPGSAPRHPAPVSSPMPAKNSRKGYGS